MQRTLKRDITGVYKNLQQYIKFSHPCR